MLLFARQVAAGITVPVASTGHSVTFRLRNVLACYGKFTLNVVLSRICQVSFPPQSITVSSCVKR